MTTNKKNASVLEAEAFNKPTISTNYSKAPNAEIQHRVSPRFLPSSLADYRGVLPNISLGAECGNFLCCFHDVKGANYE